MMSDIKSQAKSSRNTKLHILGGRGTVGKQLPTGAGSTWNGVAGVDSGQLADEQKIRTRKDGGRVGGAKMKARLDRKPKNDHDEDDGYNKGGRVLRASGGSTGSVSGGSSGSAGNGRFSGFSRSGTGPDEPDESGQDSATPRTKRASGGKVGGKGKTNITIVMAPGQGGSQGSPQAVPVPRPVPIPVQAPPPGAGSPMGMGAPPVAPPPVAPPSGLGRKAGGRVTVGKGLGLTAGGGSGEGRIQKAAMQKRTYP